MKKLLKILKNSSLILLVLALLFACSPADNSNQSEDQTEEDIAHDTELWNAVNPLNTTVSFLNTGAHPDDERSDILAYLSRGLGVKTSSIIANRGEGGQNQIGTELGDGLGIIRSAEMEEAAEVTGVTAHHLSETTSDPIYDFGFSKTTEETLDHWGEDLTYERFIRFIRNYQPDIVMPSFRDVPAQHGHHRAMTVLSLDAFEDAADPDVYPEQIEEGLNPWQIKKMYLPAESGDEASLSVEIGDYDPIYEMSYPQLGEESRYLHESQGMGDDVEVEPREFHLELVDSTVTNESEDEELFTGLDYDFKDWASSLDDNDLSEELTDLQETLDEIVELYPERTEIYPEAFSSLEKVQGLKNEVENSDLENSLKNDLLTKLDTKEEQLNKVALVSSNISVDFDVSSTTLAPGEDTEISATVHNEGENDLENIQLELLTNDDWEANEQETINDLEAGGTEEIEFTLSIPDSADYYHPYDEDTVQLELSIEDQDHVSTSILEFDHTIAILPEISVEALPEDIVMNTADLKDGYEVTIETENYSEDEQDVLLSLDLPEGWTSEPEKQEFTIQKDIVESDFTLIPPNDIGDDDFSIEVIAEADGKIYKETIQDILYDHIDDEYNLYPAEIHSTSFELQMPEDYEIGYIESGFDNTSEYLSNIGMDITALEEEDLNSDDLNKYDAIVTGIRANLEREDLVENNEKLHDYVEDGGHLVYQYHKPWDEWDADETLPYFLELGEPSIEWRVTDETADVEVLQPEHKLFNYPNEIKEDDWDNWVQERGLYFPMNWSDEYESFVSMADPDEEPFDGGILLADYGDGSVLYTNLVFYRQIDNQVPGGYRIFTNLISYGADQ
ncbi:MAG: NEW3 domain-containing protein [Atopostipes sp.]|nr:NEW3 domain-containing protein [Atopostipes sp.]